MDYHKPVLLNEVLAHLKVKKGSKYIDATLGDGGHTLEILRQGGIVMGLDASESSLERATQRITSEGLGENFKPVKGNFRKIFELGMANSFDNVSGILYDLGYSSSQLTEDETGLSFIKDMPLDMRIDKSLGVTAEDLLNSLPERALEHLIREYSDEHMARRFAQAIVEARNQKRIHTTAQLAKVIADASPLGYERGRIHPATRTFQALRIAVNDEIDNLISSLPQAARLLLPGGQLLVISFHSLEDRAVKEFGRGAQPNIKAVTKKPIVPTEEEVRENNRSRSAKLRVLEKI
jgi:16S rRNA (cytosine1402-N4)-methyltransferase